MSYLDKIVAGVMVFPLIAAVFTFPYAIFQYHKYGSVSRLRTLIIYSFILYLLISYFQIMLPLPARASTEGNLLKDHLNLIPFRQVWLYWHGRAFSLQQLGRYLQSFSLWQLLLNVVLTIPFGVYLRYYFKKDLKGTVLWSFLLSLFFELTQLTALYGIYPGPYRLADVEDLICNTLGGVIGYAIAIVFARILPSRDAIDAHCRTAGQKVTGRRRFWAVLFDYAFDLVLFMVIEGVLNYAIPDSSRYTAYGWTYFASFFCLFSLLQTLVFRGVTLGHALCRMVLVSAEGGKATAWQLIRRYLCLWCMIELPAIAVSVLTDGRIPALGDEISLVLGAAAGFYYYLYFFNEIFRKGARRMIHDRFSGTVYMATRIPEKTPAGTEEVAT